MSTQLAVTMDNGIGQSAGPPGLRRRIRVAMTKLPFGLDTVLINRAAKPAAGVYRRLSTNFRLRRPIRVEAARIGTAIEQGARRAFIVYDNLVSPPTYGEIISAIVVARYFIARGLEVSFVVIDSGHRDDWSALTREQRDRFLADELAIPRELLDPDHAVVERRTWEEFHIELRTPAPDVILPFAASVLQRTPVYHHNLNLFNRLLGDAPEEVRRRSLFSRADFARFLPSRTVGAPYVSWVCRYSASWSFSRNLSDEEFVRLHAELAHRFPDHLIMVVSDEAGCAHFAEVANREGLACVFSKQYSDSFLGDGALLLNSDFVFQLRGGGIGIIPMYSQMPYVMICPMINQLRWSSKKAFSWESENQRFIDDWFYNNQYLRIPLLSKPRARSFGPALTGPRAR